MKSRISNHKQIGFVTVPMPGSSLTISHRVTAFSRDHENEFVEMVTKKTRTELDKIMHDGKQELEQSQARINKLDDIIQSLMRTISRARFLMSILPR